MQKKIELAIPEPCQQGWHRMTATGKGRFCDACNKEVIDFTGMTDTQVAAFFQRSKGMAVCGRFFENQLDKELALPRKPIPWVKYFFRIALPAFLLSSRATAQGNARLKTRHTVYTLPSAAYDSMKGRIRETIAGLSPAEETTRTIAGIVTNEQEIGLANVTVVIKGTSIGAVTNDAGFFSIKTTKPDEQCVLQASGIGFSSREVSLLLSRNMETVGIQMKMQALQGVLGGVIVVRKGRASGTTQPKMPLIVEQVRDTARRLFRLFPNPVMSGNNIHIEWKQSEEGYYLLEMLNTTGQVVHRREIWVDKDARLLTLDLPDLNAGDYFLRITNKLSGKATTEKVVVQ